MNSKDILYSTGKNDECITLGYAVEPIIKYIPEGWVVWCPFDTEESEFVKQIQANGNKVIHSHICEQYNRIIKDNGAIVLFGSEPFSTLLRYSNLKMFKYDWIWEKEQGANFMLCKYQPYKVHENISVFSKNRHIYIPQMTVGKPYISGKGTSGEITRNVVKIQKKNEGTRYPRSIQRFNTEKSKGSFHPTQKPISLLEYLIKTYTNEGEVVLDNCMGSGSTCVASINTGRHYIGYELEPKYFEIAEKRIEEAKLNEAI